jgi:hypothetical protein
MGSGDHLYGLSKFTFLFFLQCSIDLKDNVLRVGGGEIAVPFLQGDNLHYFCCRKSVVFSLHCEMTEHMIRCLN